MWGLERGRQKGPPQPHIWCPVRYTSGPSFAALEHVGLAVGVPFKSRVAPLLYPVSMRAALARALIGNAGLIGGFELIGALTPRRHVGLYAAMRFVKYALVPLYILLAAPHLFQWIDI